MPKWRNFATYGHTAYGIPSFWSHRLWVSTVRKVAGLNPGAVYWMDIFHIDCKNCIVCLQRPKIDEKEAVVVPFL